MAIAGSVMMFVFVTLFFLLTSAFMYDAQVRMINISQAAQAFLRAIPPKPARHITSIPSVATSTPTMIAATTSTETPVPPKQTSELRRGFRLVTADGETKLEPLSDDVKSMGTISIPSFALLALRVSGETITSVSIPLNADRVTAYLSTSKGNVTKIYAIDTNTKKAHVIKTIDGSNGIVYATYGIRGNHLILVDAATQNIESAITLDLN